MTGVIVQISTDDLASVLILLALGVGFVAAGGVLLLQALFSTVADALLGQRPHEKHDYDVCEPRIPQPSRAADPTHIARHID